MKEFYEAFIQMQAELPAVMKSKQGQAGQGKFKYADLTEIVETIRPIMAKHGFAFMQPILTEDGITYLRTKIIHKSGHSDCWHVEICFQGEDIKKFGAAITYYRRYALQSILGLVADVDADDLPDVIKKPETTHQNEEEMLTTFIKNYGKDNDPLLVGAFFRARSSYNKRTLLQNIADFIGHEEAFLKEFTSWMGKRSGV